MASRKPKYDIDHIYKITYTSAGTEYADNVAAYSFERALEIFRLAVAHSVIKKIERTDVSTYYGAIV